MHFLSFGCIVPALVLDRPICEGRSGHKRLAIWATLATLLLFDPHLFGNTIKVMESGVASGFIGTTEFVDAAFTITGYGNTANVILYNPILGTYLLPLDSAHISISGVGTFQFLVNTIFFVNQSVNTVGFSDIDVFLDLLIGPTDPAFGTWQFNTSIGPVSGLGSILQWSDAPVYTTAGYVALNDEPETTLTFRAVVPEPATIVLVGMGLIGIGWRKQWTKRVLWHPSLLNSPRGSRSL